MALKMRNAMLHYLEELELTDFSMAQGKQNYI